MKKLMTLVLMMAIAFSATAHTHRDARTEARVITDRMAYELRLSAHQRHAVYDINLRMAYDPVAKNHAMRRVLTARQFERYMRIFGHHHSAPIPPHQKECDCYLMNNVCVSCLVFILLSTSLTQVCSCGVGGCGSPHFLAKKVESVCTFRKKSVLLQA